MSCAVCGEVFTPQREIPATGHREIRDEPKEPTCTEPGRTAGSHCAVCGQVFTPSQVLPALGHVTDRWTVAKAVTCTTEGTETARCARCGETVTRTVAPAGHKPTGVWETVEEATCIRLGMLAEKCAVCGEILRQEQTPTVDHTVVSRIEEAATCTKEGVVYSYCAVCAKPISRTSYQRFRTDSPYAVAFVTDTPDETGTVRFTFRPEDAAGIVSVACACGEEVIPVTLTEGVYAFTVPETPDPTATIVITVR